jgi:hypothetical protein
MSRTLTAHVVPEHGSDFAAEITNLSPSSLFLLTRRPLVFREAVTVRFSEVSVSGEVAFACREPAGAVVTFRPSDGALREIEEHMDELEVLVGAADAALANLWDDATPVEASELPEAPGAGRAAEDPTNTEGTPLADDEDDPEDVAPAESDATTHANQRIPERAATEVVSAEQLHALKSAGARRAGQAELAQELSGPVAVMAGEGALDPERSRFRTRTQVSDDAGEGAEEGETTADGAERATAKPTSAPRVAEFEENTEIPDLDDPEAPAL